MGWDVIEDCVRYNYLQEDVVFSINVSILPWDQFPAAGIRIRTGKILLFIYLVRGRKRDPSSIRADHRDLRWSLDGRVFVV